MIHQKYIAQIQLQTDKIKNKLFFKKKKNMLLNKDHLN